MDKIKKKMIEDLLMESRVEQTYKITLMQHIEKIVDSDFVGPGGVSRMFDEWVERLPSSQVFEVVRTRDTFNAIPYEE